MHTAVAVTSADVSKSKPSSVLLRASRPTRALLRVCVSMCVGGWGEGRDPWNRWRLSLAYPAAKLVCRYLFLKMYDGANQPAGVMHAPSVFPPHQIDKRPVFVALGQLQAKSCLRGDLQSSLPPLSIGRSKVPTFSVRLTRYAKVVTPARS